jgi:hypothetical protein
LLKKWGADFYRFTIVPVLNCKGLKAIIGTADLSVVSIQTDKLASFYQATYTITGILCYTSLDQIILQKPSLHNIYHIRQ